MKIGTKIENIFKFNERVLAEGSFKKQFYSLEDLKQKLFFTKVFMSNSAEVFEKYYFENNKEIFNYYNNNMSKVKENVEQFIDYLKNLYKITISDKGVILKDLSSIKIGIKLNELKNNKVYYLTLIDNNEFIISEQIKEIKPILFKNQFIRSDLSIIKTLNQVLGGKTYMIKVTNSIIESWFTKIEISSEEALGIIRTPFSEFINPYLNLDSIFDIINIFIEKKIENKKKIIGIKDVFENDQLILLPEDGFDNYLNILNESINNPNCISIFMTIYRIGKSDKILKILSRAVELGIKVLVNIELKAYGEQINYEWRKKFLEAGIKVITSQKNNYKVHSKVTLIEFASGAAIVQIGTGNYNETTAKSYTDLMLFTTDEEIVEEVRNLIKFFIGTRELKLINSKSLLVTRLNFRKRIYKLIQKEIKKGKNGYIGFKCNGFSDPQLFALLEKAQRAGVKIDLIVRGVCTWIPDSFKNLQIKSIIWDKLEHSRVYIFGKSKPIIYIGSLDMISAKINERIETLVLIKDPLIRQQLIKYMLWYIHDSENSWKMIPGGDYVKIT